MNKMNSKVYAGIVTYNPNIERLQQNILAAVNQVEKIVIVDNASKNVEEIEKFCSEFKEKVFMIKNQKNNGIAMALNQIIEFGTSEEYSWALTLDQDSIIEERLIKKYELFLNNYSNRDKVGILSPDFGNENPSNDFNERVKGESKKFVITSGSLNRVEFINQIGKFEEGLFIDAVDWEICIKMRNADYDIIKVLNTYIDHELGKAKFKSLFGKVFKFHSHSPIRYYYLNRNVIRLVKMYYKSNPSDCLWMVKRLINKNIGIGVFEANKINKIKKMIAGLKDGALN